MNNRAFPAIWKAFIFVQAAVFACGLLWCMFPIPYWDMIDWILAYLSGGISTVFAPDNEHPIPIPRLLIGLDIDLFGGALWPVSAASLSALFVLCALIGRATISLAKKYDAAAAAPGCALVVSLLLRGYTIPDYFPINSPHLLALFFAVLACAAIIARPGWAMATVAMALALAASGCGSNGLAVLPVLAWLAWRLHGNIAVALVFVAACVVIPALYIRGMNIASPTDLSLIQLVRFLVEYFGVPWTRLPATLPLAWVQGGVIIATLTTFILCKALRGSISPCMAFLLGVAATVLGVALMTGVGRASSVDLQTQGSRYGVYAATAQAVFLALLWPSIWLRVRDWHGAWRALTVIVIVGLLFAEQIVSSVVVYHRTIQITEAARRLCSGSTDPSELMQIYPKADRALEFMHEIENRKLYCFRNMAADRP